MVKKVTKYVGIFIFAILLVMAVYNLHNWFVCGNQDIKIKSPNIGYSNNNLYVNISVENLEDSMKQKTKVKLLDSNGKKVKNVKVSYDGTSAILNIPSVEEGTYYIEGKVSSNLGKDTVKKEIYIYGENSENVTITFDKGIYKPGDVVNFRALLTNKDNDEPVQKDVNVSIYDGNDNKVYNENVKTSDYGILSGKFTLANEVNSGIYKLVVKTNNTETTKQFKVNPYVTPKYEVKINYNKEKYLVGDTAQIGVNAKYFYGEAVKDATFKVFIDGKEYKTLTSDANGNAILEYKVESAKTYSLKIEAVDSSNYFVESTSSFTVNKDAIEIQLLPEYGALIDGRKNDVYIMANNPDGKPLKAYITVASGKFVKTIATDEKGIGKFSIDLNEEVDYSSNNYGKRDFSIRIQDANDNSIVNKKATLDIVQRDLLVSTDKVKYNEGENIKIKIDSLVETEKSKDVFIFKNDKLLKIINTNSAETEINLENTYGLIDIYVSNNSNLNYNNENNKISKRTIFIKPSKELNINLKTDKDEYKPGDNISISFNTTNEENAKVDSALLVSMLDNSVLDLASNDLSIDNIKMALQSIKLSDDLDLATLYSYIIDESSEQLLTTILLKQNDNNSGIVQTTINNSEEKQKSIDTAMILLGIIVLIVIVYLCVRFSGFKNFLKHFCNFIIFDFLVLVLFGEVIEESVFNGENAGSVWSMIGLFSTCSLIVYITLVSRIGDKLFKTSVALICTVLVTILLSYLYNIFDISYISMLLLIALFLLICVLFAKVCEIKDYKIKKVTRKIYEIIIYIIKFIFAVLLSTLIIYILGTNNLFIYLLYVIYIVCIYGFNILFNESTNEMRKKSTKAILVCFACILVLVGGLTVGRYVLEKIEDNRYPTYRKSSRNDDILTDARDADMFEDADYFSSLSGDGESVPKVSPNALSGDSDPFSEIGDLFTVDTKKSSNKKSTNKTNDTNNANIKKETETVTDEHIRNIFLESMCFIPELVTTDGNAKLDLKLSDNITTWTIQTVGNTKDGRIGFGTLDNVKVFKDFFADFELPKNLIEKDNISIPITVYNYTDNNISTTLKIKEEDWFSIDRNNIGINIGAKSSNMVYIPINILKFGKNKFRVEVSSNGLTDIIEKECEVSPKGYKVEKVVSTGVLSEDIEEDVIILDDIIENTANVKVKIYSSNISQIVEGMENIFRMPTGCFEQVSSTLYPNILALKYLKDNNISNDEINSKALSYISSGYQKLLTYEVKTESGGYSLYGRSPAETVLTAYGLMEISDLSKVYDVDKKVIDKMTNYLYKNQNSDGTFKITGNHVGGANSRDKFSLNAYITWALSESNPSDDRLKKSVKYLKSNINQINDNYTLALVANVLVNVNDKTNKEVLKKLEENISVNGDEATITSNITDYYGSKSNVQNLQTVALVSMAFSKANYKQDINKLLIKTIISNKDKYGTWYSTQATILSLKALNQYNEKTKLENQVIIVKINEEEQKIDINDNELDVYNLSFNEIKKENKLYIDLEKKNQHAYYEVVEEYYVPYENVSTKDDNIEVVLECNNELKVNEILNSNIRIINRSGDLIENGMVTVSIPQGFTVLEDSLMRLESNGTIEKYEFSYSKINIYLRKFEEGSIANLNISFRASYPVNVTGLDIKAYDYYNPDIEGKSLPVQIKVQE